MLVITAYFPEMDMNDYDGTQDLVVTGDDGTEYRPVMTSSIGSD